MKAFLKYTIYINLIVSVLSVYMALNFWETDRNRAYLFIFLAVVTGFNFFFRKRYFKKFEEQKKRKNQ